MPTDPRLIDWKPPAGSRPLEAEGLGWWQASDGDVYVDPAWERPDNPTREEAQTMAREEATRRTRREAALVPELLERIELLEMQGYLAGVFLEAAVEAWSSLAHEARYLEYRLWLAER